MKIISPYFTGGYYLKETSVEIDGEYIETVYTNISTSRETKVLTKEYFETDVLTTYATYYVTTYTTTW